MNPYKIAQEFVEDFRSMEYAMKRSQFMRTNKDVAEADWDQLARSLGPPFFDHIVDTGIAATLIGHPPRRLLADMTWAPVNPVPLTNVAQLIVNGVCRVRNSYVHGEKFTGGPEGQWDRDVVLIREAHAVLREAWGFPGGVVPGN